MALLDGGPRTATVTATTADHPLRAHGVGVPRPLRRAPEHRDAHARDDGVPAARGDEDRDDLGDPALGPAAPTMSTHATERCNVVRPTRHNGEMARSMEHPGSTNGSMTAPEEVRRLAQQRADARAAKDFAAADALRDRDRASAGGSWSTNPAGSACSPPNADEPRGGAGEGVRRGVGPRSRAGLRRRDPLGMRGVARRHRPRDRRLHRERRRHAGSSSWSPT